jgi:hypothetical protein
MNFIQQADYTNIADLRASADLIEEKTDLITYLGFCEPGTTAETDEKWAILKIEQSGTAKPVKTSFTWAKGQCLFKLKFSERNNYPYSFKKF